MTDPTNPAARASARIHDRFAHHQAASHPSDGRIGSLPDSETIAAIIDAAFWASLRREEGYTPKISLAFVAPEQVIQPLTFARSLPLASQPLTRLAPAVERAGIHLGVWPEDGELRVWGCTRNLPAVCFVLEVFAPGLLVVKRGRSEESGKFVNVAVIQGDEVKVIDELAAAVPDCPDLLTSLLGLESQFASAGDVNVLIQLAVSMRAHGRGGTLLVVPASTHAWEHSILHPITYAVSPAFSVLADLMQTDPDQRPKRAWQDALTRAVDGIADSRRSTARRCLLMTTNCSPSVQKSSAGSGGRSWTKSS